MGKKAVVGERGITTMDANPAMISSSFGGFLYGLRWKSMRPGRIRRSVPLPDRGRVPVLIAAAVLWLAFRIEPVAAEPTPTVSALMNEPMSLFDWGMYTLDNRLKAALNVDEVSGSARRFGTAQYDWDSNTITLQAFVFVKTSCVDVRKRLMEYLLFSEPLHGWEGAASLLMTGAFGHIGYQRMDRPADLGERLSKITVLRVSTLGEVCEAPIYEPEAMSRSSPSP